MLEGSGNSPLIGGGRVDGGGTATGGSSDSSDSKRIVDRRCGKGGWNGGTEVDTAGGEAPKERASPKVEARVNCGAGGWFSRELGDNPFEPLRSASPVSLRTGGGGKFVPGSPIILAVAGDRGGNTSVADGRRTGPLIFRGADKLLSLEDSLGLGGIGVIGDFCAAASAGAGFVACGGGLRVRGGKPGRSCGRSPISSGNVAVLWGACRGGGGPCRFPDCVRGRSEIGGGEEE